MTLLTTDTVLDRIVATKADHIATLAKRYGPLLEQRAQPSQRSLFQALSQPQAGFILECKKASPSKGLIREDFDPVAIAQCYQPYAAAISVLTDEHFFQGDFEYLKAVAAAVKLPVLCKDFIIDVRQLRLARQLGADAALLMLSILPDALYQTLAEEAQCLGLDILTEVSNTQELHRAIALGAKIIGINNRDLRDLSVNLATTEQLAPLIPTGTLVISESGIYHHHQVRHLAPLVNGFLVGSSLTEQADITQACRRLLFGNNKVCGLTRKQDLLAIDQAGAVYGGLIFAQKSPRCITVEWAQALLQYAQQQRLSLAFVGVFVNQAMAEVAAIANQLALPVVQLHGQETDADIAQLRQLYSGQIWKAITVDGAAVQQADRLLYDSSRGTQFGGTGQQFDWTKLGVARQQSMLAGGIGPNNIQAAQAVGCFGLDLNSAVEQVPGKKNHDAITQCFTALRHYGKHANETIPHE